MLLRVLQDGSNLAIDGLLFFLSFR